MLLSIADTKCRGKQTADNNGRLSRLVYFSPQAPVPGKLACASNVSQRQSACTMSWHALGTEEAKLKLDAGLSPGDVNDVVPSNVQAPASFDSVRRISDAAPLGSAYLCRVLFSLYRAPSTFGLLEGRKGGRCMQRAPYQGIYQLMFLQWSECSGKQPVRWSRGNPLSGKKQQR